MTFLLALLMWLLAPTPAQASFLIAPILVAVGVSAGAAAIIAPIIGAVLLIGVQLLLMPKPRRDDGVELEIRAEADLPQVLMLGEFVTAGSRVYVESYGTNNQNCIEIIGLADHACASIEAIYVEAQEAVLTDTGTSRGSTVNGYDSNLAIKTYVGAQTAADSYAVAALSGHAERPWTSSHKGLGRTYARVHYVYNREKVAGLLPWKFVVRGIKLYDPRKDSSVGGSGAHRFDNLSTHEWSGNLALMAYNVLRGIRVPDANGNPVHFYGLEGTDSEDVPLDNWTAAMNEADVAIALDAGGTEKQFWGGWEVPVDREPLEFLREVVNATGGRFVENGGVYKIFLGAPGLPVASFDDGYLPANVGDTFNPILPREQKATYISGTFTSKVDDWISKEAPARSDAAAEALFGRRIEVNLRAPMVTSVTHIQRLMQALLARAQRQRRHALAIPPSLFGVEPGDVVEYTSERNGYAAKLFEVVGAEYSANLVTGLSLVEVDPADYDWASTDELPQALGSLTQARPGPKIIDGFDAEPYTHRGSGSIRRPGIRAKWVPPSDDDIEAVLLQIRRPTSPLDIVNLPPIEDEEVPGTALPLLFDYETGAYHRFPDHFDISPGDTEIIIEDVFIDHNGARRLRVRFRCDNRLGVASLSPRFTLRRNSTSSPAAGAGETWISSVVGRVISATATVSIRVEEFNATFGFLNNARTDMGPAEGEYAAQRTFTNGATAFANWNIGPALAVAAGVLWEATVELAEPYLGLVSGPNTIDPDWPGAASEPAADVSAVKTADHFAQGARAECLILSKATDGFGNQRLKLRLRIDQRGAASASFILFALRSSTIMPAASSGQQWTSSVKGRVISATHTINIQVRGVNAAGTITEQSTSAIGTTEGTYSVSRTLNNAGTTNIKWAITTVTIASGAVFEAVVELSLPRLEITGSGINKIDGAWTGAVGASQANGPLRADNEDLSAATALYIAKNDRAGADIKAALLALTDRLAISGDISGDATFDLGTPTENDYFVRVPVSSHAGVAAIGDGESTSVRGLTQDGGPAAGQAIILSGLAPVTEYELRGAFRSRQGWSTPWSLWIPVTTPDTRISEEELTAATNAIIQRVRDKLPEDLLTVKRDLDAITGSLHAQVSVLRESAGRINIGVGERLAAVEATAELALTSIATLEGAFSAIFAGVTAKYGSEASAESLLRIIASAEPGTAAALLEFSVQAGFGNQIARAAFSMAAIADEEFGLISQMVLRARRIYLANEAGDLSTAVSIISEEGGLPYLEGLRLRPSSVSDPRQARNTGGGTDFAATLGTGTTGVGGTVDFLVLEVDVDEQVIRVDLFVTCQQVAFSMSTGTGDRTFVILASVLRNGALIGQANIYHSGSLTAGAGESREWGLSHIFRDDTAPVGTHKYTVQLVMLQTMGTAGTRDCTLSVNSGQVRLSSELKRF
jgi:hypothetical protein